jgi:DNA uptake protein ComE-like DNA-binding protein
MTEEIADAIIDWIDADDLPRTNGAEDDYYTGLQPPYHCKNGPLDSLEELLLVRGVTQELLLGNDTNRNGVLDAGEDNSAGVFDPGWSAYLTIYSREQNLASDNLPRIYVNNSDVQKMFEMLKPAVGEDMAYYIAALRLYGPAQDPAAAAAGPQAPATGGTTVAASSTASSADASTTDTEKGKAKDKSPDTKKDEEKTKEATKQERTPLDFTKKPAAKIDSLYDLLTGKVDVTTKQGKSVRYLSPLSDSATRRATFPTVLDRATTSSDNDLPARINMNTAPAAVLLALPGIQAADVQSILAKRPSRTSGDAPDAIFNTTAWLMFEAGLAPSRLKAWEKYITARSQVYRVNVIGFYESGGPVARVEAIIDTNGGWPRIVYRRDLTELGKAFDLGD